MKTGKNRAKKGQSLVEFTIVGIPVIFLITSVITVSVDMWQFDNLAYGAQTTARYVAMHGRSCIQDGTTCALTVADVVSYLSSRALALDPGKARVTLTSATSSTVCNPLSTCSSNSAQFPIASDNGVNFDVTVTVTYPITNPITMFWPGASSVGSQTFNLYAMSRQRIVF
jgi:hypothetical protein